MLSYYSSCYFYNYETMLCDLLFKCSFLFFFNFIFWSIASKYSHYSY